MEEQTIITNNSRENAEVSSVLWENWQEFIPLDLYTASSIGERDCIQKLIKSMSNKADINKKNKGGWTALMYSAYCGHSDIMRYLLKEGCDITIKNDRGQTPLMLAAMCGNYKCSVGLIESGSILNETDNNNRTALFHAACCGHHNVLQLLLEKGAAVDTIERKTGFTPLMAAVTANHEFIVKELLQYGADVTVHTHSGDSAYSLASKAGNMKIINLIDTFIAQKQLQDFTIPGGGIAKQLANMTRNKYLHPNDIYPINITPNTSFHSLSALLEKLDLSKYYHVFEAQDIDLDAFLTLTDKDLKDIGIKLLGPRRKMTTAITRWHENVPIFSNPLEQAFTNKLLIEKSELNKKLEELNCQMNQERELRKLIETTLATEREAFARMISKLYCIRKKITHLVTQIRTINSEASLVPTHFNQPIQWQSIQPPSIAMDNTNQFITSLSMELCNQVDQLLHILTEFKMI